MDTFALVIGLTGAALDEAPAEELARALEKVAARLREQGIEAGETGRILDSNGNTVGQWGVE